MSLAFALPRAPCRPPPVTKDGLLKPGRNGDAVILVHGMTGTPNEMSFVAWYLNSHGYTVSCPRLANHGQPISILRSTPWQEFYASVRRAYEDLRPDHDRIYVAGLSMGALLALLLAEEFQSDIAGVGCLSPTLFYDGWNVPWYNCLLPIASKTFLRRFVYVKDEPPYGFKNERIRAKVHEYYENADINDDEKVDRMGYPYFPLSLLGELRRMSAHLSTRLGRVRSPCQILQARHDDTSSPRNAQVIYDRISSTRKEIVYLENSYHVITADQERATVAQKLTEFFSMKAVHA